MKIFFLSLSLLGVIAVNAQTQQTIRITGTRFTFPVFKKWISEYNKIHPEVKITVEAGIPADSADIVIASHILKPGDLKEGQSSVALAKYVQLPVINNERPDKEVLVAKGLTEAAFREIYFSNTGTLNESLIPFNVYKRAKAACSSVAFANHFGNEHKDIRGTGVPGDDQDLLQAVKADKNAISHNSLNLIYNLKTRRLNDSIAIIPIDLNENGKIDADEKIYATVDTVIAFVEKTSNPKIPVENINVIFSKITNHKAVTDFLQWVIINGRQFNHSYGLVNLQDAVIRRQQGDLLAKKVVMPSCTPSFTSLKRVAISAANQKISPGYFLTAVFVSTRRY